MFGPDVTKRKYKRSGFVNNPVTVNKNMANVTGVYNLSARSSPHEENGTLFTTLFTSADETNTTEPIEMTKCAIFNGDEYKCVSYN